MNKISAISDAKRLRFKRIEEKRNADFGSKYQTLPEKGKKIEMITTPEVPINRQIKDKEVVSLHKITCSTGDYSQFRHLWTTSRS